MAKKKAAKKVAKKKVAKKVAKKPAKKAANVYKQATICMVAINWQNLTLCNKK